MDFFSNSPGLVAKATVATRELTGLSSTVLYILLVLLVVFVLMMLMNVKLSFSWLIPKWYTVKAASYKFWAPSGVYTNLTVPSSAIRLSKDNYTMMVEGLLLNSRNFQSSDGPYRHLLHRGSNELKPTNSEQVVGCSALGTNPNLPSYGLPKRLNPGIFLDPNTNDILVFVDTSDGVTTYRESLRIADVPLDIPFNLAVNVQGRTLEVYLNCGLEATKVLSATPREVENVWYGLAGSASAEAQVQNLSLWTSALTADDLRAVCAKPTAFKYIRPACNGTDKLPNASTTQNTGSSVSSVNLGVNQALCNPAV